MKDGRQTKRILERRPRTNKRVQSNNTKRLDQRPQNNIYKLNCNRSRQKIETHRGDLCSIMDEFESELKQFQFWDICKQIIANLSSHNIVSQIDLKCSQIPSYSKKSYPNNHEVDHKDSQLQFCEEKLTNNLKQYIFLNKRSFMLTLQHKLTVQPGILRNLIIEPFFTEDNLN